MRFTLRILGVAVVLALTLIVISLSPVPATFATGTVGCPPGYYFPITPSNPTNPSNAVPEYCVLCPAGYYCPNTGTGPPGSPNPPIPCPAGDSCPEGSIEPIAPIPEYPLGLPILAILILIGYGVIRRKTVAKQR